MAIAFKLRIKVKQAFQVVFAPGTLLNRAYFFVAVPFFTSIIVYVSDLSTMSAGLKLVLSFVVLILNVTFQLYLWSTQFFYAQQISENDWGDYGLYLAELFTDFGIKLRLLVIRIFWNIPTILLVGLAVFQIGSNIGQNSLAVVQAGASNPSEFLLYLLSGSDTTLIIVLLFVAIFYSQVFAEQVLVQISQYLYAQTNSLRAALQIRKIWRLFRSVMKEMFVVVGVAFLPELALPMAFIALAIVSTIPILGGLVLGFVLGLYYLYQTLLLGNLQGQIWLILRQNEKS